MLVGVVREESVRGGFKSSNKHRGVSAGNDVAKLGKVEFLQAIEFVSSDLQTDRVDSEVVTGLDDRSAAEETNDPSLNLNLIPEQIS